MKKKNLTPEERRRRREKIYRERTFKIYIKITIIFLLFLLITCVFNIFSKDKEYSETENRMLAQKPEFSLDSLASGDFMTDMEDYVTDQFFLRDSWINLKLLEDMALGKRESNGVYIGKKSTLMEIPENNPDEEAVSNNLEAIRDFALRHEDINSVMTLIPNAAYVCHQLLPANAPVRDQQADIDNALSVTGSALTFVDVTEVMTDHREEDIYYKTDHHWTSLGARYAFEALAGALGIENPALDYDIYPVTHSFSGTLASKSGYDKGADTIEIYVPQGVNTDCVVNYVDEQKKSASIYDSSALEQKDQYEVFFGGNHTRIDITTPLEENKNLLLFKDSYANCFVQFLVPYYRSITIIDPRYYYDDIDRLIRDNAITDVLFLYNVNTFMTDNSLADVLAETQETNTDDASLSDSTQDGNSDTQTGGTDNTGENGTEANETETDGPEADDSQDDGADSNEDESDDTSEADGTDDTQ